MPTSFERNLSLCFNKIKRLQSPSPPPPPPPPSQPPSPSPSSPPQHHRHRHRRHHSNPNLIKNFNTLYDVDSDDSATVPEYSSTVPEYSAAVKSNRFFFSSPGQSNSIIESSIPSTSSLSQSTSSGESTSAFAGINGGVAIPTISPDPFYDFRKSMQEMVEAREDARDNNWEYLHELLTCYLDLNPKSAHKFIVGAFADLLVTLMSTPNN